MCDLWVVLPLRLHMLNAFSLSLLTYKTDIFMHTGMSMYILEVMLTHLY